jgi:nucleoid-associated protein YgaU
MGLFGKKDRGPEPPKREPPKPAPPKPSFGTVRSGSAAPPPSKPRADFSNVQSGGSSTAPPAPPAAPPAPAYETYVVASGDSLSKIAKRFYGKANLWPKIHEANRDVIKNPDLIQVGWTLKIPKL